MKKIFMGLGVIILLALAGRAYWAYQQMRSAESSTTQNLVGKDIAPIDDSDLRLSEVVVLDQDNAYFDLIKIDKAIYYPEDKKQLILDMAAGKAWDQKFADELIVKNKEAFGYFADAALKPKFQDPIPADPVNITADALTTKLNPWRNMATLSAVKSLALSKQGKDSEAMEEAMRSVIVGQKIQNSQGSIIEYIVATAMKGVGLKTAQEILAVSKLKTVELKNYIQGLSEYYKNEEGLVTALKVDYQMITSVLEGIAKGSIPKGLKDVAQMINNPYYYQPNKTKELSADIRRLIIKNTYGSCADIKLVEVKDLSIPEAMVTENAVGIIFNSVAEGWNQLPKKKCQEDALVGATQAMFALKAFKNDTKKYPTTLNELVPKYLDVVPTDPFDGKQLKYSAEKKIVYSIGEDKKDDGGVMIDETKRMPDIVYPIGF